MVAIALLFAFYVNGAAAYHCSTYHRSSCTKFNEDPCYTNADPATTTILTNKDQPSSDYGAYALLATSKTRREGCVFGSFIGSIPADVGKLTKLTELDFNDGSFDVFLTGAIPPELGNLTGLTYVHFDRTIELAGPCHTFSSNQSTRYEQLA